MNFKRFSVLQLFYKYNNKNYFFWPPTFYYETMVVKDDKSTVPPDTHSTPTTLGQVQMPQDNITLRYSFLFNEQHIVVKANVELATVLASCQLVVTCKVRLWLYLYRCLLIYLTSIVKENNIPSSNPIPPQFCGDII